MPMQSAQRCNPHNDAICTMRSHKAIHTMPSAQCNPHNAIPPSNPHNAIRMMRSHKAIHTMLSAQCDPRSNPHNAIRTMRFHEAIHTVRSYANLHDAIPWDNLRCYPHNFAQYQQQAPNQLHNTSLHDASHTMELPRYHATPRNMPYTSLTITSIRITYIAQSLQCNQNHATIWATQVQGGYCQMNGTWRYMIGQVPQPTKLTGDKPEESTQYERVLAKWNTICDSLEGTIRCTVTVDATSHVHGLSNYSLMWKKLQTLYRNAGFLERDATFIRLSTKPLKISRGLPISQTQSRRIPHG